MLRSSGQALTDDHSDVIVRREKQARIDMYNPTTPFAPNAMTHGPSNGTQVLVGWSLRNSAAQKLSPAVESFTERRRRGFVKSGLREPLLLGFLLDYDFLHPVLRNGEAPSCLFSARSKTVGLKMAVHDGS
jgi:hypothetical protein